jgi:hypothetical protein
MSFLAYEDMYHIENFYPREGIRRLSFNKFNCKYKSGPLEDKSSIVYLSNTEEPLRRLKNERKNIVILSESFRQDRDNYICCFIIKNELIANINSNVLIDYFHFANEDYSLFVFRGSMDIVIEDIEYLKTLNIDFEFLTDTHTYTWQDI